MILTGFTLPIIGIVVLAIFYALVVALSVALFFWLPGPAAVPAGALFVALVGAGVWLLLSGPVTRCIRMRLGGRLERFRRADLPLVGPKAGWLAAMLGSEDVPQTFVLPRMSLWQCEGPFFRLLLWPRLSRFLAGLAADALVRSSVGAEDRVDSGLAGRWRSVRLQSLDARSVRSLLRVLRAELLESGPHAILIQPHVPGPLTLVASFDLASDREDLVRIEEYENAAGDCSSEVLERWSVMERGLGRADGGTGKLGTLLRCERAVGGPVLLELVGVPPKLVQVRELAPPKLPTYARRALIQGGEELLPPDVESSSLATALSSTLRGRRLGVVVHERRLYFRVRDQLELFARTPWPRLVLLLMRAERALRVASMRTTAERVLQLLVTRALIGALVELGNQLEAGPARLALGLRRLALDAGDVDVAVPVAASGGARGRWLAGILPWREGLNAWLAHEVARLVERYLAVRREIEALTSADAPHAAPADVVTFDGERIVVLDSCRVASATVAIHHGDARGRIRRISSRGDLAAVEQGDVLWSPSSHAWLSEALPRVAAVLLERGGSLTHLALNCRVRGIPCASGVSGTELRDGDTVEVRIDEEGCRVTGMGAG